MNLAYRLDPSFHWIFMPLLIGGAERGLVVQQLGAGGFSVISGAPKGFGN
jgi:hypothetical protein